MKSLIYKDKITRQKFLNKEISQKVLKYTFRNLLNDKNFTPVLKKKIYVTLYKKSDTQISRTKLVRRCVLTGRSRSALRFIGISRIKLRELIRDNKIKNAFKNSW